MFKEQDARACSAVLKVRPRARGAGCSGSFKTEEKTRSPGDHDVGGRNTYDHDELGDEHTSAPTGMSRHRAVL